MNDFQGAYETKRSGEFAVIVSNSSTNLSKNKLFIIFQIFKVEYKVFVIFPIDEFLINISFTQKFKDHIDIGSFNSKVYAFKNKQNPDRDHLM